MQKLLVANRGEIARRVFRTARSMGIATVAVFSDADDGAPHTLEADEAVRLPGVAPAHTYLDIDKILDAARRTQADAIHPGYGFLSENAGFARACAAAGITFVGPSPEAIDAMGSKIAAKEMMAAAGVPILRGATVHVGDDLEAVAAGIGWPLLVKAAFGGGGRGMRVVHSMAELADAVASAQREAGAAFGNDTVFLERFVEDPRHIEVQVFGDAHGTVLHFFERECSIQRRYQKIIEEAPSPAVDDDLRSRLCDAAITAAHALHYVGAGTVEFVADQQGNFFFLEVNTRLQVEHPVTEMITGLDLVELQLRVARGEPLPAEARHATINGHAVEARLYAEDVPAGFVPASGRIERFSVPVLPGIRVDSGYETGSVVSTHYDAMLAKVVSWAPTREEATAQLARAIEGSQVHGPPTNRELLVQVLRHPEYVAGHLDTGFLVRHQCTGTELPATERRAHAVAAALARQAARRGASTLPSGWRNVPTALQHAVFHTETGTLDVGYRFHPHGDGIDVEVDGAALDVQLWSSSPDRVDLTIDGIRRRVEVHRVGATVFADSPVGASRLTAADPFPLPDQAVAAGSLLAPMPGAVVRVLAAVGDRVAAGEVLVVMEAMKMEHRIQSPSSGTVAAIHVVVGDQVETGRVLAIVEEATQDVTQDVAEGGSDE